MSASLFSQALRELFHHHHAWPAQYYEERLALVYSRLLEPGDTAIDVGAHTGYHSIRILKSIGPSGKLICVEPLPEIFSQLKLTLADHPGAITLFNGVLSDTQEDVTFQHAIGLPGESGLRERVRYDLPNTQLEKLTVQSKRLDDLVPPGSSVKYIKIDTEGAELTILSSGIRLLEEARPIISAEWGSDTYVPYGHKAHDLFRFSRSHQYSIFDLFGNMVCSEREWLEVSDRGSWDFLLVPDEKIAWFVYRQNE